MKYLIVLLMVFGCCSNSFPQSPIPVAGVFNAPGFYPWDSRLQLASNLLTECYFSRNSRSDEYPLPDTIYVFPDYFDGGLFRSLNVIDSMTAIQVDFFDPRMPIDATYPIRTGRLWRKSAFNMRLRYADFRMEMHCLPLGRTKFKFPNPQARRYKHMWKERDVTVMLIVKVISFQACLRE